jgi:hypothetical protein
MIDNTYWPVWFDVLLPIVSPESCLTHSSSSLKISEFLTLKTEDCSAAGRRIEQI